MEKLHRQGGNGFIGWVQWTAVALTAVPILASEPGGLEKMRGFLFVICSFKGGNCILINENLILFIYDYMIIKY